MTLADEALELVNAMALHNPCDPDTPEFDVWLRGAAQGLAGRNAPTVCNAPAYAEGWEWGREWKENSEDKRSMQRNELRNLQTGDIVRSLLDGKAYVVTGNYGDRITAVCSIDITNPIEWELVIKAGQG